MAKAWLECQVDSMSVRWMARAVKPCFFCCVAAYQDYLPELSLACVVVTRLARPAATTLICTSLPLQESITLTQAQLKPGSGTNKFKGDLGPVPQGFLMTQSNSVIKVEVWHSLCDLWTFTNWSAWFEVTVTPQTL